MRSRISRMAYIPEFRVPNRNTITHSFRYLWPSYTMQYALLYMLCADFCIRSIVRIAEVIRAGDIE